MGIPKFFRYISERYPCISEYLRDYQIPEFDNLYLDMNGIVHACSHPNDSSVLFRISEENIFKNIFHYTEVLFHMIQPRELFFIAVDGVAPRAKINHQRSRRFRAARETEVQEAKARAKGIEIPKEKKFDSNCITPGTVFMSKLNKQLKYFVTYKISTDKLWQRCKIIFSGSEVPGEGEHKIMDYIRYLKVQPDYDPNTRHCLYGLDADLIMLGLCTHEKHFTLLREEVTFGKKRKKILTPEETKFCLLHLSLLREYINHEFSPIKDKLPFPYDIEKIIDDWVLMGFLVGNDFIPHLPNVHMAHGALPMLNNIYMDILPTLEGYINEAGTLRLDRFEKFMEELSHLDALQFSEHYADLKYFKSKTGRRPNESERHSYRKTTETCDSVASPKRVQDKDLDALIKSSAVMLLGQFHEDDASDDDSDSEIYQMEFVQHKRDYYMNKLEYENIDADFLRSQAEGYVRAIQWNLHYYYNGCCSWSWYYPHHYAPYISDIKDFKDLKLEFEMGEPFLPFQQLLAVLPPYSKDLLPAAFQPLLTEEQSPIIDYYPVEFKTDLNGKVQDWEAVVLIPFIDAEDLLDAMAPHFDKLTPEEQERNKHGPMYLYSYTKEDLGICKAPEYFPDINSHAELQLIEHKDIIVPREKLIKGRHPDARSDVYYPGFPTLQHIQHTASLSKIKPRVFDQPSRGECMMLRVTPSTEPDLMTVASELLGKSVFVNWPHLTEAQVVGASNCDTKISLINPQMNYCYENINEEEMKGSLVAQWNLQLKHITEAYKGCLGIDIGKTNILVHARPLIGSKYIFGSQGKLYLEKQWSELQSTYAYQVVVKDITVYCINAMLYKTVNDIFVSDSICFMLGHPHYGAAGKVLEPGVCERSGRIRVSVTVMPEPTLEEIKHAQAALKTNYMHGSIAAQHLGISSHLLSRITGTIYVKPTSDEPQQDDTKYNVGLNLKFNKKNEEIPGYTRNENGQWLYSTKAIDLIRSYMAKCPELFERLAENISKDIFQEETLFDKSTGELNDIVAWLKEKLQGMESRACGTEVLDACIVQKLEEKVDEYLKTQNNISKVISMQVKPHLLFKPGLHLRNLPPDPRAQSRLLDRICCTKDCFTAPLGSKGTIIGIQKTENRSDTMYDILFDKPFPGGLSLNGCSEFRAYRLSTNDFINITYGEEIENGKASITDAGAESVYTWRSSPNQKTQSRSSAFASFRKEGNRLKTDTPKSPQFRIKTSKKNSDETNQNEKLASDSDASKWQKQNSQSGSRQVHKASESVHQNAPSKNIEKNQPSVIPTSEFQALWNELHKKQKSNETSKTQLPAPRGAKIKQIDKDVAEDASQDPSAFLKAMLKISDVDAQRTAQSGVSKMFATNTVPQEQKISDAPPLVQRLFDYARQSEKVKEEKTPIWYCSQLLNYYQLSGLGMPRYTYFTDGKSSLVQTRILLPDARVFVGEPCPTHEQAAGSAAKKVYTELNLGKAPPDLRTLIPPPQQWCTSRQSSTWTQNVHPPMVPMYAPSNSQGPQHFPQWPTKVQQTPAFPPMMMHPNQFISPWTHSYNKPKYEIKNCMPFVPLQAQQKSRNITAKQGIQESNQCAKDNLQSVMQQRKTESTTKETKVQAVATANEKQAPAQSNVQQTQIKQNVKPKKSRVAAKFCTPSQTEENYNKNTT